MTTLSDGTTTVTPQQVLGYSATRTARNVIHPIVGRPAPEVTLRPAGPRSGTLELLLLTLTDALAATALLEQAVVLTLADADFPGLDMSFVASGALTVELEDENRNVWIVSCDFQEVSP